MTGAEVTEAAVTAVKAVSSVVQKVEATTAALHLSVQRLRVGAVEAEAVAARWRWRR